MPLNRKTEHPAFEVWRKSNPIYKLARRQQQSMREYLACCGYGQGATLALDKVPSMKVLQKVADHEGIDTFSLANRCREWFALRPDHAWLHHALDAWRRACPIRRRRDEMGYSQRELNRKAGVHFVSICKHERGDSYPDVRRMELYGRAFGIATMTMIREYQKWWQDRPTERNAKRYLEKVLSAEVE